MVEALKLLRQELRFTTASTKIDAFATRLQGWWFEAVVEQLMRARSVISGADLESELEDLREQFRLDNLPIDFAEESLPDSNPYKESKFVRQLQHIKGNLDKTFPRHARLLSGGAAARSMDRRPADSRSRVEKVRTALTRDMARTL